MSIKVKDVFDNGGDMVAFYREQPVIAAYDLLGVELTSVQRVVLEDMWFKNYVISVCTRGFGKSQSIDSVILVSGTGMVHMWEVLPPVPSYLQSGEDEVIDYDLDVYTFDGFNSTRKVSLEHNIHGRRITTSAGFINEGSNHHPILVSNQGILQYKSLEDVQYGDKVYIQINQQVFGSNHLTKSDAYLIGVLTATKSKHVNGCVLFYFNNDDTTSFFVEFCNKNNLNYNVFGDSVTLYDFTYLFDKYGLGNQLDCVPYIVRTASKDVVQEFLRGFFDTKCEINGAIYCYGLERRLASEIQLLLANFGIVANVLNIYGKYVIVVHEDYTKLFVDLIGCNDKSKQCKLKLLDLKCPQVADFFIDTVHKNEEWSGDCYDFMMESTDLEPNYFSNGFINHNTFILGVLSTLSALLYPGYRVGLVSSSFRQAKFIFAEVEKLYAKSPILRQAAEKRPIRGSDTCYLKFKSVGGQPGSFIEAIPIGNDGAKIRGSRFYLVCVDELVQVPPKILDLVLRPMGATKQDPMEHVKYLARKKKLIEAGLATEEDFEEDTVNKMVMTSSGYYKFNHMYARMRSYWNKIAIGDDDSKKYAVHQVPYTMLPEGFLDMDNIEEARRTMPDHEFRMEYEADMVSDSEGFFKASVVELCTINSGFNIEITGSSEASYIIGIDPNQGGSASCGIIVCKLEDNKIKVVFAKELKGKTTQDMVTYIQSLCDSYNVARIFMDQMGGGNALKNLLEEGYNGYTPILDRNDNHNLTKEGLHILEMVHFNPAWISNANFTTLAYLEDTKLLFPEISYSTSEADDKVFETIDVLKRQMFNIVVTQNANGSLHFDTPKKGQNKDLYSALIMAVYGAKIMEKESEIVDTNVTFDFGGLVRAHNSSQWDPVDGFSNKSNGIILPSSAILTPRNK